MFLIVNLTGARQKYASAVLKHPEADAGLKRDTPGMDIVYHIL